MTLSSFFGFFRFHIHIENLINLNLLYTYYLKQKCFLQRKKFIAEAQMCKDYSKVKVVKIYLNLMRNINFEIKL